MLASALNRFSAGSVLSSNNVSEPMKLAHLPATRQQ
jgi:hypothetical protein